MTLTVVVGSSGSGKTTYLEDVHKLHACTYIRQYHTLRPYIPVRKIPNFDPTQLPYWQLYSDKEAADGSGKKNESYNPNVKIGGTMAGEFTAGLVRRPCAPPEPVPPSSSPPVACAPLLARRRSRAASAR